MKIKKAYYCVSGNGSSHSSKNPFYVNGSINGNTIPILLDTGADVSLVNKDLAKNSELKVKKTYKRLRSATGNIIETVGEVKRLKVKIQTGEVIELIQ